MRTLFKNIKGDRLIWAIAALLAIFSFLPVYSAASNLAYASDNGHTFNYFIKHFVHLFLGFAIIYGVHKIPYRYFKGLSLIMSKSCVLAKATNSDKNAASAFAPVGICG